MPTVLLRVAIDEYDDAVRCGLSSKLYRVCHRLFVGAIRNDIDAFLASPPDAQLSAYPCLFLALMEYALIPIVERMIEGIHAQVKHVGKRAAGLSLPQICALLRQNANLDLIKESANFLQFCLREWRSRTALDRILALRYSAPH